MKQSQFYREFLIILAVGVFSLTPVLQAQVETAKVPDRSEIDDAYKWRAEDIYPTQESWERDYQTVKDNLPRLEQYKGHLSDSPAKLVECLRLADSLSLIVDNLYVYAGLKLDEDSRVGEFQELTGRASSIDSETREALAFIEPEILALGQDRVLSMIKNTPELDIYSHYLDDLARQSEHVLSEKEEALLAMAGPVTSAPGRIFSRLEDADMDYGTILDEDGNEIELTMGRIYRLLESPDRRVRKDARLAQCRAYEKLQNGISAMLESSVRKDYFFMKARGYNSCLEMSLDNNNIPTAVFHNLIGAVNANLEPLHKWAKIRKRILGVDTLYAWDQYVPLVKDFNKTYSYEDAVKMVQEAMRPMGEPYLTDLRKGLEPGSGWIDVYETQGKGGGAYSWGTYTSHPYVLLNHAGTLDNVFTIAHEMGHALHRHYTNQNQPYVYEDYAIFLAEVASTCNEALMMKYMLDHTTDKKDRMYLINEYIEQIIGTFFTQCMFSEFEHALHQRIESGEAASAEYFRKTYRDIYQKYYGPTLVIDELNDVHGLRISHFYRQYYVYQYATSYAAAQMISQKILEGDKQAHDNYMKFLAAGGSDYPIETLKKAGVDMTQPEAVAATIQLFSDLVDEMERLLDEG